MKYIFNVIKRASFSLALLYGFNIIMNAINLFIPINIYTISTIFIMGFPGLFLLVSIIFI